MIFRLNCVKYSSNTPPPQNTILYPVHLAVSRPARRAYLTTILAATTSLILLFIAIVAYILFYWSYIPRIGFERTIHLQFDNVFASQPLGLARDANPYPYGTVSLAPDVVSQQKYDVKIELELPRSRENREAGNFMLDVSLLAPGKSVLETVKDGLAPGQAMDAAPVLARSRRPAILKYRSWAVENIYKLTEMHWYLLGFRHEAEQLSIGVFEGVKFEKGWRNVPGSLRLEVQSSTRMQIYSAKAMFRARFTGLRWLMYNHRVISACIFVGTFWTTEMIFAGLAWAALAMALAPTEEDVKDEDVKAKRIKAEDEDATPAKLSDTERTFPTLSGQSPLRYRSPEVKQEDAEPAVEIQDVPAKGVEADDEDEDADFFVDSGIGTSLESSGSRPGSVRKRRGRSSFRDAP